MNARQTRRAVAIAKGRDKILRRWHAALEARGTATKDQATDTYLAGLARSGKAISRGTLYGWESRRVAGGLEGLVDGRRLRYEPADSEEPKVLTFELPGVCVNLQVSDAVIDIRGRRTGFVLSIRRRAVDTTMEAQKAGDTDVSKAD
jgi:hypothetical protein